MHITKKSGSLFSDARSVAAWFPGDKTGLPARCYQLPKSPEFYVSGCRRCGRGFRVAGCLTLVVRRRSWFLSIVYRLPSTAHFLLWGEAAAARRSTQCRGCWPLEESRFMPACGTCPGL